MLMSRYQKRSILSLGLMFIISAIIIAALFSGVRAMFFNSSEQKVSIDAGRSNLVDTSIGHSVEMLVRGPLVANEDHVEYKMTISSQSRVMNTYYGYSQTPTDSISLPNSVVSYEQFVYALDRANMARGVDLSDSENDTRGLCAEGRIYYFTIKQDDKAIRQLWTSSCRESAGSLRASVTVLRDLFKSQFNESTVNLVDNLNIQ